MHTHTHIYTHTLQHISVGIVRDREDVRRHFCASLSSVHVDYLRTIDGQHSIGIDSNTEQARVGLREEGEDGWTEGGEGAGGRYTSNKELLELFFNLHGGGTKSAVFITMLFYNHVKLSMTL